MGHGVCRNRLYLPLLPRAAHCHTAFGVHYVAALTTPLVLEIFGLGAGLFWGSGRGKSKLYGLGENFEG